MLRPRPPRPSTTPSATHPTCSPQARGRQRASFGSRLPHSARGCTRKLPCPGKRRQPGGPHRQRLAQDLTWGTRAPPRAETPPLSQAQGDWALGPQPQTSSPESTYPSHEGVFLKTHLPLRGLPPHPFSPQMKAEATRSEVRQEGAKAPPMRVE